MRPPLPSTYKGPLITFALVAYNQEQFIAAAIAGAFAQTYSPLEIILSDDHSADGTFEVMQKSASLYFGPHRVRVRRNERNLGIGSHINRVMKVTNGELVVIAAGDDISLPSRTERIHQEYVLAQRRAYSIFSNEYLIDESGKKYGISRRIPVAPNRLELEWFLNHQSSVTGSSHAWRRDVFTIFGNLDPAVISEDAAIPFRSLLLGEIRYIHEPLVLKRITGRNLSGGTFKWWDSTPPSKFQTYARRHAANFAAVYRTRLVDLDTMANLSPNRGPELSRMREVTEKKLSRVKREELFWSSPTRNRLNILRDLMSERAHHLTALRLLTSWVSPRMYINFHHLMLQKRRVRSVSD